MTTEKILKAQADYEEGIKSIKGLSNYSKTNQTILLEAFSKPELISYIELDANLHKHVCKVKHLYVTTKPGILCIGTSRTKLQLTNHTLFTLIKELEVLPSDFIIIKE